jgi:hypothetical protein
MSCLSGASRPSEDEATNEAVDEEDPPRGLTLRRDGDGSSNDEYPLPAVLLAANGRRAIRA